MSVFIYTRAETAHQTENQVKSAKAILALHGLKVDDGGIKQEIGHAAGSTVIEYLVDHCKAGDTVAVTKPSVLYPEPLRLIEIAGQLYGKGINLLVADQPGGRLDLNVLRSIVEPLKAQQAKIDKLQDQLQQIELEHQKEFDEYQRGLEKQISAYLAARGITLSHLLRPAGPIEGTSPVPRPDQGRRIRELREQLHLSQTDAGKLVDPPMDKSAVSRCETVGGAAPRYDDLSAAIEVEAILKSHEAKQKARGINPNPEPENLAVAHIRQAVQQGTSSDTTELWKQAEVDGKLGKPQKLSDPTDIEKAWADAKLASSVAT